MDTMEAILHVNQLSQTTKIKLQNMATKLAGNKLMARMGKHVVYLGWKNKSGLALSVADTKFKDIIGSGFSFYMDGVFTTVILEKDKKEEFFLEIAQPAYGEKIKLYPVGRAGFHEFLSTDYHGYKI